MLGQGRLIKGIIVLTMMGAALSGCSSNRKKYEQRDKVASATGLYCDFINGDKTKEAEVDLNLNMAKKCDPEKPYSITGYKNASEVHGLMYCCSMKKVSENSTSSKAQSAPAADKKPTPAPTPAPNPKSGEEPVVPL